VLLQWHLHLMLALLPLQLLVQLRLSRVQLLYEQTDLSRNVGTSQSEPR